MALAFTLALRHYLPRVVVAVAVAVAGTVTVAVVAAVAVAVLHGSGRIAACFLLLSITSASWRAQCRCRRGRGAVGVGPAARQTRLVNRFVLARRRFSPPAGSPAVACCWRGSRRPRGRGRWRCRRRDGCGAIDGVWSARRASGGQAAGVSLSALRRRGTVGVCGRARGGSHPLEAVVGPSASRWRGRARLECVTARRCGSNGRYCSRH